MTSLPCLSPYSLSSSTPDKTLPSTNDVQLRACLPAAFAVALDSTGQDHRITTALSTQRKRSLVGAVGCADLAVSTERNVEEEYLPCFHSPTIPAWIGGRQPANGSECPRASERIQDGNQWLGSLLCDTNEEDWIRGCNHGSDVISLARSGHGCSK